ncbi:MAG: hypothetical protein M1826_001326 [Phylliscum demangeonii]|nr:MAG: hypothetical protein M1826_001326 [Phylliscum demangeonii]
MSPPYKKAVVIGATSGIGEALADRFVKEGTDVVVTGRRKENLDAFVKQHEGHATLVQFDITQLEQIPSFVSHLTRSHPDIDCVVLNSGIQRGFNFVKPETVDLPLLELELKTNYLSYIHLITAFLPFLQAKTTHTSLVLISSGLAWIPLYRCPNYCASKAALHHFAISLREQLKGGTVQIIEIVPPAVQTELHDEKHQPDLKGHNASAFGMPLADFTEDAYQGLIKGDDEVVVGQAIAWYEAIEPARHRLFGFLSDMARKMMPS